MQLGFYGALTSAKKTVRHSWNLDLGVEKQLDLNGSSTPAAEQFDLYKTLTSGHETV